MAVLRRSFCRADEERAAPCHCPVRGQRSLVRISERKAELFLRAAEMAGSNRKHILPIPGGRAHRREGEGFPGCGTRAIQPEHRDLESLHTHGSGDPLSQQIAAEQIPDRCRLHVDFPQRQDTGFFLHRTLRLLPGLRPEEVILTCHIEQFPQRSFRLLAAGH